MSDREKLPSSSLLSPKRYAVRTACACMFPLLALVAAGAVYFLCLSNHLTQDSVAYIYSALSGEELLHPHHLLYNPLMRIVAVLLDGAERETVIAALQYANMTITLGAVWIVWLVVRCIGAPVWASVIYAMFFALSTGILTYSSQVEVYTVTVLFLGVAILGLLHEPPARGGAFAAGGWFVAMLFHQTAIFFGAGLIVCELLRTPRLSFRHLIAITVLPLAAIGVVYLTVCWQLNCGTPTECWQWMTSYSQMGFWGKGTISYDTFTQSVGGMLEALGSTRGKYALCLLVFFIGMNLVINRRHLIENKSLVAGCLAWCAVQAFFSMWWFAPNPEFWIFALLPLTLCLAAVAHSRKPCSRHSLFEMLVMAPIIIAIVLGGLSAFDHHQRNRSPNRIMSRVVQCVDVVTQQDTVVTADNKLRQYCRLYLKTDHVIAFNTHIARKAIQAPGSESFTQKVLDALASEVRQAQKRGGSVFIDQRIIRGSLNSIRLMKAFDPDSFSRAVVAQFDVIPLAIPEPRWYEIRFTAEDMSVPASGL